MGAIKQIRRNIHKARREKVRARNSNQALYQRGVGDINYIGAEVGDYLNRMNSNISGGYDAAGSQMAAARAALQGQLSDTTNQNASEASSELNRLGIGGSGLGSMRSDSNFAQMVAAQQGTAEQANNSAARANSGAVGQLLLGMNQGQRQAGIGNLLNARNDMIATIRNRFQDERASGMDAINDILASRAKARAARSSGGSYGGYSSGGYSSGGGGGGSIYDQNVQGSLALIDHLNGGTPRPRRRKRKRKSSGTTSYVGPKMGSSFSDVFGLGG
jgi:hypothetical protein